MLWRIQNKLSNAFPRKISSTTSANASTKEGLEISSKNGHFHSLSHALHFKSLNGLISDDCYDEYCPSLQVKDKAGRTILERRTCPRCGMCHYTIKATKSHKRLYRIQNYLYIDDGYVGEEDEEDEGDDSNYVVVDGDDVRDETVSSDENIYDRINSYYSL